MRSSVDRLDGVPVTFSGYVFGQELEAVVAMMMNRLNQLGENPLAASWEAHPTVARGIVARPAMEGETPTMVEVRVTSSPAWQLHLSD